MKVHVLSALFQRQRTGLFIYLFSFKNNTVSPYAILVQKVVLGTEPLGAHE